jgi:adenylate cyclase
MKEKTMPRHLIKPKIRTIFWITIAWTIVSIFQFTNGYAVISQLDCDTGDLDGNIYFLGSVLTGILAGLFGGIGVVFAWEEWLRSKKYSAALLLIFASFTIVYLMVAIPVGLFFASKNLGLPVSNPTLWQNVITQQFSLSTFQNYMFWLLVVLSTIFILQVNDKYGPGVLPDFLKGKYFNPQREERIFMFLDLRSSTTIAESLGEEKYFNFLHDVFKHTTPAILRTKGEIYQYVGDEIVISWKMKNGLNRANCLHCFFQVERDLKHKEDYFKSQYGIAPIFKAGLHSGNVMAGEIGVVKRDIVFSGDVLNTTSRIQDMCNKLGVNILISKSLMDRLIDEISQVPKIMGNIMLKGKEEEIPLFTV